MTRRAPSVMTPEMQEKVIEGVADGLTLAEIHDDGGPKPSTVCQFAIRDREFGEQYALARKIGAQVGFDRLVKVAQDTPADSDHVQKSRLVIDAIKWRLSKQYPADYGDKTQITGDGGGPVKFQAVATGVPRPDAEG